MIESAQPLARKRKDLVDIEGQTFGTWTVREFVGRGRWLCCCECGNKKVFYGGHLRASLNPNSQSACHCKLCQPAKKFGPQIDLTGKRFGNWTAISHTPKGWKCRCDCGNIAVVHSVTTRSHSKSCIVCRKHPKMTRPAHAIWDGMMARCYDPSHKHYENYGGRGITVCDSWHSKLQFVEDMFPRPEGHTLDRIDNNGNYSKENCKWSTRKEQQRNRRTNHVVTIDGVSMCITDWCERTGVSRATAYNRIRTHGWCGPCAVTIVPYKGVCDH